MQTFVNMLAAVWAYVRREPAVIPQVVGQALAIGTSLGLHLNPQTMVALSTAAALLASLITRINSVPTVKVADLVQTALLTPVPVPQAPAAAEPAVPVGAAG